MKSSAARLALLLALPCVLLPAGCRGGAPERAAAADTAQVDTTNEGALDGVSSEQMEASARSMTPEQAERLGIVDTTIHVESLQSPDDSALARGAAPAPPPPAAPASAPDSAPR